MRTNFTIFMCLIFHFFSVAQTPFVHGTIIFESYCKDGILLMGDSRGNVNLPDVKGVSVSMGYFDNIQKIFVCGNKAVSLSGISYLNNIPVGKAINEYYKTGTDIHLHTAI